MWEVRKWKGSKTLRFPAKMKNLGRVHCVKDSRLTFKACLVSSARRTANTMKYLLYSTHLNVLSYLTFQMVLWEEEHHTSFTDREIEAQEVN